MEHASPLPPAAKDMYGKRTRASAKKLAENYVMTWTKKRCKAELATILHPVNGSVDDMRARIIQFRARSPAPKSEQ